MMIISIDKENIRLRRARFSRRNTSSAETEGTEGYMHHMLNKERINFNM
jgi:hypothetical protein